jgi:hypothetical protein
MLPLVRPTFTRRSSSALSLRGPNTGGVGIAIAGSASPLRMVTLANISGLNRPADVVDGRGKIVKEAKVASEPEILFVSSRNLAFR